MSTTACSFCRCRNNFPVGLSERKAAHFSDPEGSTRVSAADDGQLLAQDYHREPFFENRNPFTLLPNLLVVFVIYYLPTPVPQSLQNANVNCNPPPYLPSSMLTSINIGSFTGFIAFLQIFKLCFIC